MHLRQGVAAHALDREHRGASGLRVSIDEGLGGPRLDPHHAHPVRDDVM